MKRSTVRCAGRGLLAPVAMLAAVAFTGAACDRPLGSTEVGRQADGSALTPVGQFVTPAGSQVEQSGRPMDLAIRPGGETAVDLTKSGRGLLTVIDLASRRVLQQTTPPKGVGSANIGVMGLLYSPDGASLWATQASHLLHFPVNPNGTLGTPVAFALPGSNGQQALPTGLAWSPERSKLLVVLDGDNALATVDPSSGKLLSQIPVGNAPRDVAVIGNHAYVSNEAGRPPGGSDFTNLSYKTPVVAEPRDGRANSGTVSEVDLTA